MKREYKRKERVSNSLFSLVFSIWDKMTEMDGGTIGIRELGARGNHWQSFLVSLLLSLTLGIIQI